MHNSAHETPSSCLIVDKASTISQKAAIKALASLTVTFPLENFNKLKALSRCVADCNLRIYVAMCNMFGARTGIRSQGASMEHARQATTTGAPQNGF
jgi:hypothetical protein